MPIRLTVASNLLAYKIYKKTREIVSSEKLRNG